ncbi:hypothetical protein CHARACLAT_019932 [Characodon lateralis]|uniref:Uncharacterized protein n=1 Tax=Characodon lateralis TaxID=208331 RepID=A0ABU7EE35_9TELE|nr:hypothetical protein [Characodon lateralis]
MKDGSLCPPTTLHVTTVMRLLVVLLSGRGHRFTRLHRDRFSGTVCFCRPQRESHQYASTNMADTLTDLNSGPTQSRRLRMVQTTVPNAMKKKKKKTPRLWKTEGLTRNNKMAENGGLQESAL